MNAREAILTAVAANKPALREMPEIDIAAVTDPAVLIGKFSELVAVMGGTVRQVPGHEAIAEDLATEKTTASGYIVNTVAAIGEIDKEIDDTSTPGSIAGVEKAYIKGMLGVAENGAIWVEEHHMQNRLLPFLCQHLVLVVDANTIVDNLHEAYDRIRIDEEGYGLFIAGPSKTADIEQSLVVGAHGPRSLLVYIVG